MAITALAQLADKVFGEHSVKWLLGASNETYHYKDFSAFRNNYLFPDYPVLDVGDKSNQQTSGDATEWTLQSFFSRVNYDYQGKYLFEAECPLRWNLPLWQRT